MVAKKPMNEKPPAGAKPAPAPAPAKPPSKNRFKLMGGAAKPAKS